MSIDIGASDFDIGGTWDLVVTLDGSQVQESISSYSYQHSLLILLYNVVHFIGHRRLKPYEAHVCKWLIINIAMLLHFQIGQLIVSRLNSDNSVSVVLSCSRHIASEKSEIARIHIFIR